MPEIQKLRDKMTREQSIRWDDDSPVRLETMVGQHRLCVQHGRFVGGAADQVEVVQIDNGKLKLYVLPSRGMSIWAIESGGTRFGWESPIAGPVHPSQVPVFDPSGLGWLEGFDELLVRCGLESNGAPEHDQNGQLVHPLHGRVGNLPADSLSIEFDESTGELSLIGEVIESRLFFKRLRLTSRLSVRAGDSRVQLVDEVTNDLKSPATMQLLYHINVGSPVLQDGAEVLAPVSELAPKDDLSASEIDQWNQMPGPEVGYAERVYFAQLNTDNENIATAMLGNADRSAALAVSFDTQTLPYFILWKNPAGEGDGYVAGLEPATNFPNGRSFEQQQGRVVSLEGQQSVTFRVTLDVLTDADAVGATRQKIESESMPGGAKVHTAPKSGWSA